MFLNISLAELELCEHDRTDVVSLGTSEEMECTVALHFANGGGIDTRFACRDTMRKGCEENDGRLETVRVAVE